MNYGTKTYDGKCATLAANWIDDCDGLTQNEKMEHTDRLAGEIQQAIEDYLEHQTANAMSGATLDRRAVPEGFDAVCETCRVPYGFDNAKHLATTEWQRFCCRTCAGEPLFRKGTLESYRLQ